MPMHVKEPSSILIAHTKNEMTSMLLISKQYSICFSNKTNTSPPTSFETKVNAGHGY